MNMKPFIYFLFGALVFFMTACSEDTIAPPKLDASLASRATTPHAPSELNPTLLTDWENCEVINLSVQGNNGLPIQITPPWKDGHTTTMDYEFGHDIKKSHGWIMLFHTFCKPNLDPGLNYLCFYNRFTGYLKFMYMAYEIQDEGTHTSWRLGATSNNTLYPFFSDYVYFSTPAEGVGNCNVASVMSDNATNDTSGLTQGWNGFQIRVGEYIPSATYPQLNIRAYNTVYTDYNFFGKTEETTKGTISTINTSDQNVFQSSLAKASLNVVGDKAKDLVDSFAKSHLDKNFLGINFASIITNIAAQNYVGAIASGVSAIFKLFVHKKPTYSVSEVSLKTEGTVTIDGSSSTQLLSKALPLSFNLNNILSDNAKALAQNEGEALLATLADEYAGTTELGVWNVKKKPTVYYDRYTRCYNEIPDPIYDDSGLIDFNGNFDYPSTTLTDVEIVFNPAIKPYVKSYTVNTTLVDIIGGNRSVPTKNCNVILYDRFNFLSTQGDVSIYGIGNLQGGLNGSVYSVPGSYVDTNTRFYLDWGENVSGYRAAVVSLTMNVDYMGETQTITESRVFDVEYKPNPRSLSFYEVNNPPYSFVVNQPGNYFGFDLSR